uniref:Protein kinase domain-containing protein n=1 Tax=Globodera rostochiensis TaxID=31243 RepID=A0A914HEM5_GLORO
MDDDTNNSYECNDDDESEEFVSERLPTSNNVIRGQKDAYAVGKKIGSGKYGAVYEVLRRRDGKMFAAKLEVCGVAALNSLNMDYVVLKAANKAKSDHFCNLVDRGMIQNHFKFLIINMLGDNLFKLRLQFQQHRFSAPTSLRLALEMLESLEQLHSLGYMHRDVKPSNFALFEDGQIARIILLDFGLCRHFKTASGGIKPPREKAQFRGTARYASLAAHREMEQSPKDDLESWFYVVVEFMTGDLPWSHFSSSERDSVKKAKEHARTLEGMVHLLKYCPRMEFKRIITNLDGLQYSNVPDYQYLRDLIILAMRNNDIRPDEPYDWEQQEVATEEAASTSSSTAKSDTKLTRMDDGRGGEMIRNGPVNGGLEQKQQQTNHQHNSNNAWR